MLKKCPKCNLEKSIDDYYKNCCSPNGINSYCKKCTQEKRKDWIIKNPEKARHHRRLYRLKYPEKIKNYQDNYKKENPEKVKAKGIVGWAIHKGILQKHFCNICNSITNIEAHHPDYSKPLEVIWLCNKHHHEIHSENKKGFVI